MAGGEGATDVGGDHGHEVGHDGLGEDLLSGRGVDVVDELEEGLTLHVLRGAIQKGNKMSFGMSDEKKLMRINYLKRDTSCAQEIPGNRSHLSTHIRGGIVEQEDHPAKLQLELEQLLLLVGWRVPQRQELPQRAGGAAHLGQPAVPPGVSPPPGPPGPAPGPPPPLPSRYRGAGRRGGEPAPPRGGPCRRRGPWQRSLPRRCAWPPSPFAFVRRELSSATGDAYQGRLLQLWCDRRSPLQSLAA